MNFKTIKYSTKFTVGCSSILYPFLQLVLYRKRIISHQSDICFGGFPRSANSFSYHAFKAWNPAVRISHHIHLPQQVVYAVKWQKPCVVLVRNPKDALGSLLIIDQDLSLDVAIRSYISYYRIIMPLKDSIVVAKFEDVITQFHETVEATNRKFGTSFYSEPIGKIKEKEIFQELEAQNKQRNRNPLLVTIPAREKGVAKELVKLKIQEHVLFERAMNIYQQFILP